MIKRVLTNWLTSLRLANEQKPLVNKCPKRVQFVDFLDTIWNKKKAATIDMAAFCENLD